MRHMDARRGRGFLTGGEKPGNGGSMVLDRRPVLAERSTAALFISSFGAASPVALVSAGCSLLHVVGSRGLHGAAAVRT